MEATADPTADTIDVSLTALTVPTTSTATIATISKPKAKVKMEWTAAKREVQN
jgi:hypothetical protein